MDHFNDIVFTKYYFYLTTRKCNYSKLMPEVLDVGKLEKYITTGHKEPLSFVPFHHDAPVERFMMLNSAMVPDCNTRISVHQVSDLPDEITPYCELHKHDFDEINLIISEDDHLVYRIQMEDEVFVVHSPASVFIPKGVRHSSEVISGKGSFICITLQGKYAATS